MIGDIVLHLLLELKNLIDLGDSAAWITRFTVNFLKRLDEIN